jgi:AraC-like DNA-binding protein
MSLIEARLQYSQHSLTEIADEFGFTDESHFCKQFRKYTGNTPTAFRKKRTNRLKERLFIQKLPYSLGV